MTTSSPDAPFFNAPKFFYVPEDLDLSFLPSRRRPHALYFVHKLYSARIYKKYKADAYIPMHSKLLEKWMGRHYRSIINELTDHGVVEGDGIVVRRRKSQGYRLTDHYRLQIHKRIKIKYRPLLRKLQERHHTQVNEWYDIHHHLWSLLGRVELTLSEPLLQKYRRHELSIQRITGGDFFLRVDDFGRVHTNLTNMKSSLRDHLTVEGQPLVELDISNSQPLMLALLLLIHYSRDGLQPLNLFSLYNSSKDEKALHSLQQLLTQKQSLNSSQKEVPPFHQQQLQSTSETEENPSPSIPPLSSALQCRSLRLPPDVSDYIGLCERGELYEFLNGYEEFNESQRRRFKRRVLSRVFYCPNAKQGNELAQRFEEHFPNVMGMIMRLKADDYRHLPQLMQRAESSVMVHKVCTRLMEEFPEMFFATIHDCLLTTEENVKTVEKVMREEYGELGLRPSIKIKR